MQIFPDPSDPTETKISKHKSEIEYAIGHYIAGPEQS